MTLLSRTELAALPLITRVERLEEHLRRGDLVCEHEWDVQMGMGCSVTCLLFTCGKCGEEVKRLVSHQAHDSLQGILVEALNS